MEIHVPHGPINSYREFLVHLGTITAGVLIALSLEGLVEWNHYRLLVREARANISREIADNLKDVEAGVGKAAVRKKNLDDALRFANELIRDKKTDVHAVELGFEGADLNDASWQTAERTGALAHMEYDEVKAYSHLYSLQQIIKDMQRQNFDRLTSALQMVSDGDPTQGPPADLEAFRQQVLNLRAAALVEEQLTGQLIKLYRDAPKE